MFKHIYNLSVFLYALGCCAKLGYKKVTLGEYREHGDEFGVYVYENLKDDVFVY